MMVAATFLKNCFIILIVLYFSANLVKKKQTAKGFEQNNRKLAKI